MKIISNSSRFFRGMACALPLAFLAACGGSSGSAQNPQAANAPAMMAAQANSQPTASMTLMAAQASQTLAAVATPDPGMLLFLLPDGQDVKDPRVMAWIDAAGEEGVRLLPVTDSAFLQMGTTALAYAGLILPDSLHALATDALISAIQNYTAGGGKTMLVFDFGALTLADGVPVYPIPKSRLSSMAGVDYILYDQLRDKTTGLGPVTAMRSNLRMLLVPPGKSMAFTGLSASASTLDTGTSTAVVTRSASTGDSSGLLSASGVTAQSALYLPVNAQDPGGVRGFDPQQYGNVPYASSVNGSATSKFQNTIRIDLGRAYRGAPLSGVTTMVSGSATSTSSLAVNDPVESYSGYLLGALMYPSYVTQGTFGGVAGQKLIASSPQFGLVAGINPFGAGQVMFVNLPLTYLKGRTDALMMHGFLHHFTRQVVGMAHLSAMPNGVGGMTLNWHLDSKAAQAPTQSLIKLNVFSDPQAQFSIDMTAGPDTVLPGDKLGWNLNGNKTARQMLKNFDAQGHSVGSHGGWIHDYYGLNVTESNQLGSTSGACVNSLTKVDNFLQCLQLNRQAVDGVVGKTSRSYSAPEGNNPLWAGGHLFWRPHRAGGHAPIP
jgi:hypothetical protein